MSKTSKICGKCEVSIYRDYVENQEKFYHPQCYKCKTCGKVMKEEATVRGFDLYCGRCAKNLKPQSTVKSNLLGAPVGYSDRSKNLSLKPVTILKTSDVVVNDKKKYGATYDRLKKEVAKDGTVDNKIALSNMATDEVEKEAKSRKIDKTEPVQDEASLPEKQTNDKTEEKSETKEEEEAKLSEPKEDEEEKEPEPVTDITNLTKPVPKKDAEEPIPTSSNPGKRPEEMVCADCKKNIDSKYIVLKVKEEEGEQFFHYGCFKCFECHGNVEDDQEFAVMDEHFYHVACIKN